MTVGSPGHICAFAGVNNKGRPSQPSPPSHRARACDGCDDGDGHRLLLWPAHAYMPQAKGVLPGDIPIRGATARHLATVRPRNRVTARGYRLPPADDANHGHACKPQTPANLVLGSHGSEVPRSRPPYCFMAKKAPFCLGDGRHVTGKTVIGANAAKARLAAISTPDGVESVSVGECWRRGRRFGARRAPENGRREKAYTGAGLARFRRRKQANRLTYRRHDPKVVSRAHTPEPAPKGYSGTGHP